MKSHIKILAILCMSSILFSNLALADCVAGYQGECNDTQNSNSKSDVIAPIVVVSVLAGIGIWYLISDNDNVTDLSTIKNNYKFSVVPISENEPNGLALQFSYVF